MNKNLLGTLAFAMLAMFVGMGTVFIVQTAMVHASMLIAVCFGVAGFAGFFAMAACAWVIHNEGSK